MIKVKMMAINKHCSKLKNWSVKIPNAPDSDRQTESYQFFTLALLRQNSLYAKVLKNTDLNEVRLNDLKSKVLLIQFTGVGCGPCHHSIPFLKQLVDDYKATDFEFISLETWSNNIEGLKRYQQKNEFHFKFLKSSDEVTKSYGVSSVPVFFVIDKNRIIRKVIKGYSKETTDKEIKENIDKYL